MNIQPRSAAYLASFFFLWFGLTAAEPTAVDPAARLAELRKLADGLKPQSGEIVLGDGIATAKLPNNLRYLSPEDAETVLVKIWGNPKSGKKLGMLVPANFNPLSGATWAVSMTYEEDGYIKDDDAAKIDYNKLLSEMKEGVREASKEREKQGYPSIELIGWASPPRYDSTAKKMYWAKEIKFGGSTDHTLNYNIRMLGRRGVLVLNVIADMDELKVVESATPSVLATVNFNAGHRYADFNSSTDKTATYGLAALVAGGIAAKTGLLKLLWVGILAFKKVIILAFIALASQFKKIFGFFSRKKEASAAPLEVASGDDAPPPPPA